MGAVIQTWTFERKGFLPQLRDLLTARIQAEGYRLHEENEGHQTYVRGTLSFREKPYAFRRPTLAECIDSLRLGVGYVCTPKRTRVSVTWESCFNREILANKKRREHVLDLLNRQWKEIREYVDEWLTAALGEPDAE